MCAHRLTYSTIRTVNLYRQQCSKFPCLSTFPLKRPIKINQIRVPYVVTRPAAFTRRLTSRANNDRQRPAKDREISYGRSERERFESDETKLYRFSIMLVVHIVFPETRPKSFLDQRTRAVEKKRRKLDYKRNRSSRLPSARVAVVEENRGKGRDRDNENSIVCLEKRHAVDDSLSLSPDGGGGGRLELIHRRII